ncbi:hypothetical protein [Arthrobacter sp. ES1]|uniref:hypothetical protein n=1 Tax=Arthrobacter sp. ES1 TaxID=1897056 RepID=UPI001D0000F4|nr:hypothetical protein [Arthrobacter sp. ES1]MCB5280644.1 hypothetical protein [Arthrobacter sp. ES1]
MPKFRVISEPYRLDRFSPAVPTHRRIRGDESVQRKVTVIDADDLFVALHQTIELREHRKRSITSIEEVFPAEALYFSDDEIAAALKQGSTQSQEKLDPEDFEGNLYEEAGFNDTVASVAEILGDTLLPGMFLTVAEDMDGANAIVHVRDAATGDYRAATAEMKRMIQDHSAEGWNGVLSIARAIIDTAEPLL